VSSPCFFHIDVLRFSEHSTNLLLGESLNASFDEAGEGMTCQSVPRISVLLEKHEPLLSVHGVYTCYSACFCIYQALI
jgi:hypothetical protein